jgi:hypothetical protein
MSTCELKQDPKPAVKEGLTLYGLNGCLAHTGVYVPKPQTLASGKLNVIVWLHGMYVDEIKPLFDADGSQVRQAVRDSSKDVVLIAPFLGHKWVTRELPQPGQKPDGKDGKVKVVHGSLGLGKLGQGVGMQQYLQEILGALANFQKSVSSHPDAPAPNIKIDKLVLACHSGGGELMRTASDTLDDFRTNNLVECWGFDCLYGPVDPWFQWASSHIDATLFLYYGQGTSPANGGVPVEFWRRIYGSPKQPQKAPLNHVKLAPAVAGVEQDAVAFQSVADIAAKSNTTNNYEKIRKQVDPLLDDTAAYWKILNPVAFTHYQVVTGLFGQRIQALF